MADRIVLVDYNACWPELYARETQRILSALGGKALLLEHVGSTSVPGLAAKPVIDLLLVVADSAEEQAYAPALSAAGYRLKLREPHWYEHRLFRGPGAEINPHVLSAGCPEVERMLLFRDWLRSHGADRDLYQRTKQELAEQEWASVDDYARAKTAVIEEILQRASAKTGADHKSAELTIEVSDQTLREPN